MAKKYSNLETYFSQISQEIACKACEEIMEMLQAMGIPERKCFELRLRSLDIVGVSYSFDSSCCYPVAINKHQEHPYYGERMINLLETTDTRLLTVLHNAVRLKYNKFIREQK